jgi:DNA-binding IclR family transcriptional regulator
MSTQARVTSDSDPPELRYRNQAAQRVLVLLSEFAIGDESRGVSELSRATGLSKNMVARILATLEKDAWVVRDATGQRYQLGYRMFELKVDEESFDLRSVCHASLEQLHSLTGESVFLSIIVGGNRVNIDWIEGQGRRVSFGQRGRSVPLHCTKMSRLLLAHLPDRDISAYLDGAQPLDQYDEIFPDTGVTTAEVVWRDIRAMRGAPHVIWRSPKQFGSAYVAFPIPGADGRLHAIVTIGGPMERFRPESAATSRAVEAVIEKLRQQYRPLRPLPVAVSDRAPQ